MAAVVNRAACLGRIVDGAQILPFRRLHLRARLRRARGILREKRHDQIVQFHRKEPAQLVQPQGPVHALRGFRKLDSNVAIDRGNRLGAFGSRVMAMQGFQMFLELEGGVKLLACVRVRIARSLSFSGYFK